MNTVISKSFLQRCLPCVCRFETTKTYRVTRRYVRFCATNAVAHPLPSLLFHQLKNRAVLKVVGQDSATFLQGLITNDIRHLVANDKGTSLDSIYTMLLNQQGRVLYDLIIHRPAGSPATGNSFLIECDLSLSDDVIRHLKTFRLRKKVDVLPPEQPTAVWCVFSYPDGLDSPDPQNDLSTDDRTTLPNQRERSTPVHDSPSEAVAAVTRDPRQLMLGSRLILSNGTTPAEVWTSGVLRPAPDHAYRVLRYRLGVAEGAEELPPGTAFPLECNADFLHGVSFQKGCYIGQELTARIHHTGVVRKRLLPLVLDRDADDGLVGEGQTVVDGNGKSVGRPRALHGRFGIGLLRLKECLGADTVLTLSGIGVRTYQPFWWPLEAPKDNLASKR